MSPRSPILYYQGANFLREMIPVIPRIMQEQHEQERTERFFNICNQYCRKRYVIDKNHLNKLSILLIEFLASIALYNDYHSACMTYSVSHLKFTKHYNFHLNKDKNTLAMNLEDTGSLVPAILVWTTNDIVVRDQAKYMIETCRLNLDICSFLRFLMNIDRLTAISVKNVIKVYKKDPNKVLAAEIERQIHVATISDESLAFAAGLFAD